MRASPEMIFEGVRRLRMGGVIAVPTETVYGLAAVAESDESVRALLELRGREGGKPLPVAVSGAEMASDLVASWPTLGGVSSRELASRFWPGPLTIVLPRDPSVSLPHAVCAGLSSIGLRCPDHPLALALIQTLEAPVVLPSANRPGDPPATSAEGVIETFGEDLYVVDGGPCEGGTPSTVVSFEGERPEVLREGAVSAGELGIG